MPRDYELETTELTRADNWELNKKLLPEKHAAKIEMHDNFGTQAGSPDREKKYCPDFLCDRHGKMHLFPQYGIYWIEPERRSRDENCSCKEPPFAVWFVPDDIQDSEGNTHRRPLKKIHIQVTSHKFSGVVHMPFPCKSWERHIFFASDIE